MMKPGTRILLVEDDRHISRLLELELGHRGLDVTCVYDGLSALPAIAEFAPDVIVLDILLPGMDGERVLRQLRQGGDTTPVVMLTARDKPRDKVRNLDTGADDYLTKPFDVEELLARLRAVLRRVEQDEVLRVGDLDLNLTTHQVHRAGRPIELTAREYDLLEFLARNARHVVSRDLILSRVWGDALEVDPNVVDVYIGYLRKKIDIAGEPRLIHTVRGVGFTLREEPRAR
ncbi:MAG TPA: response regulator transcription factor [Thermomicrobiales bacterium]|nr:response regulator transcription factor [Thermomicrobiales bacterium]